MTETTIAPGKIPNAWTVREPAAAEGSSLTENYGIGFAAPRSTIADVSDDDWLVLLDEKGEITRAGRVLRVRSVSDRTIVYFDRMVPVASGFLGSGGLTLPKASLPLRTPWND